MTSVNYVLILGCCLFLVGIVTEIHEKNSEGSWSRVEDDSVWGFTGTDSAMENLNYYGDCQFEDAKKMTVNPAREFVVHEGSFSGKILDIADGIVIQKTGRFGETAAHDQKLLSCAVQKDEIVDIKYSNGVGVVQEKAQAKGIAD